jgi:uncharacterized protein DUF6788
MSRAYTAFNMNSKTTPESILRELAQLQRLDRGTISIIRQGPDGPYYNHQCYEGGRNVSRYVPTEQVAELKEAIAGYHRFEQLVENYLQLMVARTREERQAGLKKKTPRPNSSSPRTKKSSR